MGEEGLRALRVVERAVAHAAPGSPDRQVPTVEHVPRTVAVLSCFVHDLETHRREKESQIWEILRLEGAEGSARPPA